MRMRQKTKIHLNFHREESCTLSTDSDGFLISTTADVYLHLPHSETMAGICFVESFFQRTRSASATNTSATVSPIHNP